MVSMSGRGFDSRQLHDQAQNNHPRQGVFVFMDTVASLLAKGRSKNKKTMRSMVVVLYLQDWSLGITEGTPASSTLAHRRELRWTQSTETCESEVCPP